eukprot:TRINITY_DN18513_c0_g1_i1.p1 TRINITY_DN18513_c0_g1~~TRINITY_DN18513_c0_g1_i1.p1  ORF type:complete len:112 (-),score=0.69 TRINITY_DN18513_c0_g1_i1:158-493(-)
MLPGNRQPCQSFFLFFFLNYFSFFLKILGAARNHVKNCRLSLKRNFFRVEKKKREGGGNKIKEKKKPVHDCLPPPFCYLCYFTSFDTWHFLYLQTGDDLKVCSSRKCVTEI